MIEDAVDTSLSSSHNRAMGLLVETQYAGMENEREKTRGQVVLR